MTNSVDGETRNRRIGLATQKMPDQTVPRAVGLLTAIPQTSWSHLDSIKSHQPTCCFCQLQFDRQSWDFGRWVTWLKASSAVTQRSPLDAFATHANQCRNLQIDHCQHNRCHCCRCSHVSTSRMDRRVSSQYAHIFWVRLLGVCVCVGRWCDCVENRRLVSMRTPQIMCQLEASDVGATMKLTSFRLKLTETSETKSITVTKKFFRCPNRSNSMLPVNEPSLSVSLNWKFACWLQDTAQTLLYRVHLVQNCSPMLKSSKRSTSDCTNSMLRCSLDRWLTDCDDRRLDSRTGLQPTPWCRLMSIRKRLYLDIHDCRARHAESCVEKANRWRRAFVQAPIWRRAPHREQKRVALVDLHLIRSDRRHLNRSCVSWCAHIRDNHDRALESRWCWCSCF